MTVLNNLRARREQFLVRLRESDLTPEEREQIERSMVQIETALSYLDPEGQPGTTRDKDER